jgi:tol-pal system beta propeller repeat protein TolB
MDADGRNVRRLTRDPAEDCLPSWSPDGRRIAFISYRDGKGEIYVVDVDEGNLRNLTNYPAANDIEPAWSPDGGKIAFVSDRANGVADIYVMDADGRNPRRLTKHPEVDRNPAWSPDGRWIAFMSHRWRGPNIYVMNVNDRLIKMLTMGSGMVTRWAMDSF